MRQIKMIASGILFLSLAACGSSSQFVKPIDLTASTPKNPKKYVVGNISTKVDSVPDQFMSAIKGFLKVELKEKGLFEENEASFVDATNANLISSGDRAKVTISNLPSDIFPGAVSFISDKPRTERGIVSFPITITVDVPSGTEIPVELSSVSVVITPNEKGTLLAPQGTMQSGVWRPSY